MEETAEKYCTEVTGLKAIKGSVQKTSTAFGREMFRLQDRTLRYTVSKYVGGKKENVL